MVSTRKEKTLVVIELNGGNDALNTIVPFNNSLYYDYRPGIGIAQQDVLPLGSKGDAGDYGFNPNMPAVKDLWDRGEPGYHQRHRLSAAQPLALPLAGHLVHRRAGRHRHRGLAGSGHPGPGRQGRERADRRELRARPSPRAGVQGRSRGLGGQPGDLRPAS